MRLQDKVAIITGGGSGQGRATSLIFAREGAKVIVVDWNEQGGEETIQLIKQSNADAEAVFIKTDVSDENSVKEMVNTVYNRFNRIDILFNNAGNWLFFHFSI